MKKYHYVYRITNTLNGRMYIGVRSCDCFPEEDVLYMSSSKTLKALIKKIGVEHFTKEILLNAFDRKYALHREIVAHAKLDIARNPLYYNRACQTSTGFSHGHLGKRHTAETKAKMSKIHKGKKLSAEHKAKLSEIFKGEKSPRYGKHHSPETRRKISENHADFRGEKHPQFKEYNVPAMLELRAQGKTYKQIAAIIGCSAATAHRRVKNNASFIDNNVPNFNPNYSTHLMVYLRAQGRTYREIASIIGCDLKTVYNRIKNHGN